MSSKRLKQFTGTVEGLGAKVTDVEYAGSGHIKIRAEFRGKSRMFVASASASDRRSILNFKAQVRRWLKTCRDNDGK